MNRINIANVSLLVLLSLALLPGCGPSRPATAPVHGKVTYDGKPVTQGTIIFYPEVGRSATGRIGPDGNYTLTTFDTGDGALLGKHTVTIEAAITTGGAPQPKSFQEELQLAKSKPAESGEMKTVWLVPERYAKRATTDLKAEVKPGDNELNFNIPKAPGA